MNRSIQKCISALFVLAFSLSMCTPVVAAENVTHISVHTYSDSDEQHRLTPVVVYDDSVYISAEDALILSGYDTFVEDYGEVVFNYGYHSVKYKEGQLDLDGIFYYPLKSLMDALSTMYYYDETTETVIFITCTSYFENLLFDCETIYSEGYELDFLEGTGWQVAGVYEIIAGLRIDAIWGGYQTELYEDTIKGILATEDSKLTATLKQGNSIMSKLSKLLEFAQKDINGLETYADFLGTDIDGIIEAYSILDELVPGIDIDDAIEILDYVLSSIGSADVFPNAVKYGLVENPFIMDNNLSYAADRIYSLYDENKEPLDVVLEKLLNDVMRGAVDELGEEAAAMIAEDVTLGLIEEILGLEYGKIIINTAYVKLAKLIFDELGMKERSTAVMQTVAARNIQYVAKLQYELSNGNTRHIICGDNLLETQNGKDPLRTKYSTILYLRACQYAYSLYEFDPTLNHWSSIWREKTTEAISKISAYSDDELTRTISNKPLQIDNLKTYTTDITRNYCFVPTNIQAKSRTAEEEEVSSSICFKENLTCDITFNMEEWTFNCSATYQLFACEEGRNAIKVDLSGITIEDGKTHKTPWFYLVEISDGTWEYYGEGIGLTCPGTIYTVESDNQFALVPAEILPKTDIAEGVYTGAESGDFTDFTVLDISDNGEITFSVEWYSVAGISDAVGMPYGYIYPFKYAYYIADFDEYFDETIGVLEFEGETVTLTLFETALPDTALGSYYYNYYGSIEEWRLDYNRMVLLELQSDTYCWVRRRYYDFFHSYVEDMFIKFYEDGSVRYWIGTPWGGDTIYKEYSGNYEITHDLLYIDGDAYELSTYTAGSSTMTLRALGEYEIDFSGDYICENNDMFRFFMES